MRLLPYIALLGGVALATALVAVSGIDTVAAALATAGWQAGWVALWYAGPLALAALGWRCLFVGSAVPSLALALKTQWVGMAVNWLLPVAQVGGEFVRARLMVKAGLPGAAAGASVVVDKTVQALNTVLFGLVGIVVLLATRGGVPYLPGIVIFLAVLAALIVAFYRVQRAGLFQFLARRVAASRRAERWQHLVGGAEALDLAITEIYRRPARVASAVVCRLAGRFLLAGEMWLALYVIGHPVSLLEALMLESLGQAIRGGAFFVPGAIGVQEGGFMLLAPLVGLPPESGLAVSLIKRGRELLVGLPALAGWQIAEGRWLWRRGRDGASPTSPAHRTRAP